MENMRGALSFLFLLGITQGAYALVFTDSGDVNYQTIDPHPERGWKYQGYVGSFLGTAIGPRHFITSDHIGRPTQFVSDMLFNGVATQSYQVDTAYNNGETDGMGVIIPGRRVPGTDFRIYQIEETFSDYALLYTGTSEMNKAVRMFGNSAVRGDEVFDGNNALRGWKQGTEGGGVARWGDEVIAAVDDNFLYTFFEGDSGQTMLNVGDSGGGLFLWDGATWRLAGIHYAATLGPWDTNADHSAFIENANLFATSGMYYRDGGTWQPVDDQPSFSVHSRISTSAAMIQSMLLVAHPVPEPQSFMFVAMALVILGKRRR